MPSDQPALPATAASTEDGAGSEHTTSDYSSDSDEETWEERAWRHLFPHNASLREQLPKLTDLRVYNNRFEEHTVSRFVTMRTVSKAKFLE